MGGTRLWALGASDPEMERIEGVLLAAGELVAYATAPGRDGRPARVHSGNAYKAASPIPGQGEELILVECGGAALESGRWRRADHHRPGDAGYGRPPGEFLPASSLGQVISLVGGAPSWEEGWFGDWSPVGAAGGAIRYDARGGGWWVQGPREDGRNVHAYRRVPRDLVLAAAADHCLAAACMGACPGVKPASLLAWRTETQAAFQRRPPEAVRADVEAALEAIVRAPTLLLGSVYVADMRALGAVPELLEASAASGTPVLYRLRPGDPGGDKGGRVKVGILGAGEGTHAGTRPVEAFLGGWAAAEGLVDCYPAHDRTPEGLRAAAARGYAGAYEP